MVSVDALPTLIDLLPQSEEFLTLERASSHLHAAKIELINTLFLVFKSGDKNQQAAVRPIIDHLFHQDGPQEFKESFHKEALEALLPLAMLRRAIFTSQFRGDDFGPQKILEFVAQNSTDLTLAALEILSPEISEITKDNLSLSAASYLVAIKNSSSSEVRSVAVSHLAQALDLAFNNDVAEHLDVLTDMQILPSLLKEGNASRDLSNATIRISGWLLLAIQDGKLHLRQERMESWGEMLTTAGDAYKVRNIPSTPSCSVTHTDSTRTLTPASQQHQPYIPSLPSPISPSRSPQTSCYHLCSLCMILSTMTTTKFEMLVQKPFLPFSRNH